MDAKVKKLLKATKQETGITAIDFASGQRSSTNGLGNAMRTANGVIPSKGEAGQFGSFLKKNK